MPRKKAARKRVRGDVLWLLVLSGSEDDLPISLHETRREAVQVIENWDYEQALGRMNAAAKAAHRTITSVLHYIEARAVRLDNGVASASFQLVLLEAE
jgi:hypothetical protein